MSLLKDIPQPLPTGVGAEPSGFGKVKESQGGLSGEGLLSIYEGCIMTR